MIVCMVLYSSTALSCYWVDNTVQYFDAEQSRVASVRSYVLSFYHIFMTRPLSNATVEMDRLINQITYINDILLPA